MKLEIFLAHASCCWANDLASWVPWSILRYCQFTPTENRGHYWKSKYEFPSCRRNSLHSLRLIASITSKHRRKKIGFSMGASLRRTRTEVCTSQCAYCVVRLRFGCCYPWSRELPISIYRCQMNFNGRIQICAQSAKSADQVICLLLYLFLTQLHPSKQFEWEEIDRKIPIIAKAAMYIYFL